MKTSNEAIVGAQKATQPSFETQIGNHGKSFHQQEKTAHLGKD